MDLPADGTRPQTVEVIATIQIGLTKDGEVIFKADVPSLAAGITMFETAKLDFYMKCMAQRAVEAQQKTGLQIAPKGFNPNKLPNPEVLRKTG